MKTRRVARAALPKFWRPKVTPVQQLACKIVHWDLIDRFTNGTASVSDCWDWMETGFTYTQMMRLLADDGVQFTEDAIQALLMQLETYEAICARLRRTGRPGLSGPELQIAKQAAAVMDELIDLDRHGIAERAARWSMDQMARIRRAMR